MSASNFTSSAQGWDLDFLGGLTSSNSKELQKWKVKAYLRNFYITLEEFLILMKFNIIFFFSFKICILLKKNLPIYFKIIHVFF